MQYSKNNISHFLLSLEEKYDLLTWNINSVLVWEIIRIKVFLLLQEKTAAQSFGKIAPKSTCNKVINICSRILNNFILGNPFFRVFEGNIIIFESGRKYSIGELNADIYTYFIAKNLEKENIAFEFFETSIDSKRDRNYNKTPFHIDSIKFVSKVLHKFISLSFSDDDVNLVKKLEGEIEKTLNIPMDLKHLITSEYKIFISEKIVYKKLLHLKHTKKIFLVNYSEYFSLLSAANDLKIETVELQHGLILKEAMTYHFPNSEDNKMNYFPTKFYVWKDFSYNSGKLPLSQDKIVANPHNHLEFMKNKFENIVKNPKSIVVASQPFYSLKIQDYILKNARVMTDYRFIYKLHPMEFQYFFESGQSQSLLQLKNVNFVKNEISIYQLLKESRYIIGIYSTSLFEAEMFQCIPVVLPIENAFSKSLEHNKNTIVVNENTALTNYI